MDHRLPDHKTLQQRSRRRSRVHLPPAPAGHVDATASEIFIAVRPAQARPALAQAQLQKQMELWLDLPVFGRRSGFQGDELRGELP